MIPSPIMALLGILYPQSFPFHPNWKGGATHPAINTRSPVIYPVYPGAWGGDWNADDNLVTARWPCNANKADSFLEQLGWPRARRARRDGLVWAHRPLPSALGGSGEPNHWRSSAMVGGTWLLKRGYNS